MNHGERLNSRHFNTETELALPTLTTFEELATPVENYQPATGLDAIEINGDETYTLIPTTVDTPTLDKD